MSDKLIEVYSDQSNDGWRAEAVMLVGPVRRVVASTDGHSQPYEAELAVSEVIVDRLTRIFGLADRLIEQDAEFLAAVMDEEAEALMDEEGVERDEGVTPSDA